MFNTKNNDFFSNSSFVGFDRLMEQFSNTNASYPPHNIIKIDDNEYVIELAIAGFTKDDITLTVENKVLTITNESTTPIERNYLHKGISTKQFSKSFTLMEHVEVLSADMNDGILKINLEYSVPENKKTKTIDIGK